MRNPKSWISIRTFLCSNAKISKSPFFNRAWRFFKAHYLHRSIPHGIVSIQYLIPGQFRNLNLKAHFQIWRLNLPNIPLPLALLLEFFLWLKWALFFGWRSTWRCVQKMGPEFKKQYDTGLFLQFRRTLFLSLFYCIPPNEIYAFRLIRKNHRPDDIPDYVFTHELPGVHRWQNVRRYGENRESISILQDKYRLTSLLEGQGIPMVPILKVLPQDSSGNSPIDLSPYFKDKSQLLCKPRHGSAAKGIFVITSKGTYRNQGPEIFTTRSGIIRSHTTFPCLKKELRLDDYLVQPFMINHPLLGSLCNALDAVTIRIITQLQHCHSPAFFCAMLEIPMIDDEKNPEIKKPVHLIVPIDHDTGKIRPFPGDLLNPSVRERYNRVYATMNSQTIPFWKEMCKNTLDAHHQFQDVYGIAWDFVVTPDGAFLLEGNTGWGSRVPQRIAGGLLRDGTPIK